MTYMYNDTVLAVLETVIHGKYVNQCLSQSCSPQHIKAECIEILIR